jgi:hypothetical protein
MRPPFSSVPIILYGVAEVAMGESIKDTSDESQSPNEIIERISFKKERSDMMAPFGAPVLPLVYSIRKGFSSSSGDAPVAQADTWSGA